MNRTIYKYRLPHAPEFDLQIPAGAKLLHVGLDSRDVPCVWVVPTGGVVPDIGTYKGTFIKDSFVGHLYYQA